MGKYNKGKFTITTLPRTLLRQIDALKRDGESRADVITRLIEYYLKGHEIVKTPTIVQGIENLVLSPRRVVLPARNSIFRKKGVIGNW